MGNGMKVEHTFSNKEIAGLIFTMLAAFGVGGTGWIASINANHDIPEAASENIVELMKATIHSEKSTYTQEELEAEMIRRGHEEDVDDKLVELEDDIREVKTEQEHMRSEMQGAITTIDKIAEKVGAGG